MNNDMTVSDLWRSPLDPERVMQAGVVHWQEQSHGPREDLLAVEEPLEVRVDQRSLAIIMRTPGHDFELAAGFLFTEGVLSGPAEILAVEYLPDDDGLPQPNVVNVRTRLSEPVTEACLVPSTMTFERRFVISSSCGLCGKNSISDLLQTAPPLEPGALRISASVLYGLPARLREQQAVFSHTGGLHAAALFTLSGELLLVREDVGRHNAVDKLIGHALLQQKFPYQEHILLVSGRTSYEILQKAFLARIPCIAAISAPSSLAVELAAKCGITLAGFLRGSTMNVYTFPERII
jgi:FdhD protein